MIAPLRRRHRLMIGFVTPLVIVFFVLALKARPYPPVMEAAPSALIAPSPSLEPVIFERPDLFQRPAVQGRVRGTIAGLQLELEPLEPLRLPSVLVYWTDSPTTPSVADLAAARLLGPLSDTRTQVFPLPNAVSGGHLVLYSLGHQEIVATAEFPTLVIIESPSPAEPEGAEMRKDDSEAREDSEEQGSAEEQG